MRILSIVFTTLLALYISTAKICAAEMSLDTFIPDGIVTVPFGVLRPIVGFHNGIDVTAPLGTPIFSPEDATVIEATDLYNNSARHGKVVLLEFDSGFSTLFTHLHDYSVKPGDRLVKGSQFALLGRTGGSRIPHVHIEAYDDIKGFQFRIDPASRMPFLSDGTRPIFHEVEEFYKSGRILGYSSYNTETFAEIYENRWQHDPTELAGLLYLPRNTRAPAPVVVLQHGGSHPNRLDAWWRELVPALNNAGIGAFIANSYSGRGIEETGSGRDQFDLSRAARVVDAYMALNALSKESGVDSHRIGISGYSAGGRVSLDAFDEKVAAALSQNGNRFVGHLPVFPSCIKRESPVLTGAPIRFLLGAHDDFSRLDTCFEVVADLEDSGYPVSMRIFKDGGHGFISPRTIFLPNAASSRNCPPFLLTKNGYTRTGSISDKDGWKRFVSNVLQSCAVRGAHLEGTVQIRMETISETVDFFKRILAPKDD